MQQEHLEKLIATNYKLIALETDSPEQTVIDFRPLVRQGKAIYVWENRSGLSRLEASHINIPNTQTPEMVLNHIKQSKLYGIFLLVGFNKEVARPAFLNTFEQIAEAGNQKKVVFFIDSHFDYPQKLMSKLLIAQEPTVRERNSFEQIA